MGTGTVPLTSIDTEMMMMMMMMKMMMMRLIGAVKG